MKRIALIALLLAGMVLPSIAHEGYQVHLKMQGVTDSMVYLVHYYGKPLPSIYKRDSARFNKDGVAVFSSTDSSFVGGIYMMLLSDKKTYFEFLLNNGDNMDITVDISKLPEGVVFKNSPQNDQFQEYVAFLRVYSVNQQELQKEYKAAKTAADTSVVRRKSVAASRQLTTYRRDYIKAHPGTLLAAIFNALEVPQVPDGDHYLADGKTRDSLFTYNYYKAHFWDGFNFQDDRLIHTPIYHAKLEEYMNKLVVPTPDSFEKESDMLLTKTRGTKDLFKYTLWWLTRTVEDSKIMGMDEAFVYLVENYYMKGDAIWLSNADLTRYLDRAQKIAPNVLGNLAPEVKLPNIMTKKPESMLDLKAKYTLLVFYSPSCAHCQKELPAIDSIYKAVLKGKGMKVYTVAIDGEDTAVTGFVTKYKLEAFTNTWDHERVGDWRGKYDVYSTPAIYLLDEKKIIRGKRLDHSNIAGLVNMLEKKEKETTKKTDKTKF